MRYYPIIDTTREKGKVLQALLKNEELAGLLTSELEKADALLVGGGDGFMLETIKNYHIYDKPFFGVNCGTLGFLLNDISRPHQLPKTWEEMQIIAPHLLNVQITQKDGTQHTQYVLNDVVLGRNILDYFTFHIDTQEDSLRVQGTGLIITTPLGSSAYRLSNGGPLLSPQSKLLGIMGIASRPFHHKCIPSQQLTITAETRKDLLVGIDGYSGKVEQVKKVCITPSEKTVRLGFLTDPLFDDKRTLLADQKLQ